MQISLAAEARAAGACRAGGDGLLLVGRVLDRRGGRFRRHFAGRDRTETSLMTRPTDGPRS